NNDGKPDLVVSQNAPNALVVITNNGNGTFGPPVTFGTSAFPRGIELADLDADGRLDVLMSDQVSDAVTVFYNTTAIWNTQSASASLGRTPWQMFRNPFILGVPQHTGGNGGHGDPLYYGYAPPIPVYNASVSVISNNGGWTAAPDGSTIGFTPGSRLPGNYCLRALDFTFFQTLVDIPANTNLTTFTI